MKYQVRQFRPELERLMSEARAELAMTRFEPVRVKGELSAAAQAGRCSCLLSVEGPVDLRQTPAALILLAWMEREKLRTEWLRRPVGDVAGDAAWDLLVSWRRPSDPS